MRDSSHKKSNDKALLNTIRNALSWFFTFVQSRFHRRGASRLWSKRNNWINSRMLSTHKLKYSGNRMSSG